MIKKIIFITLALISGTLFAQKKDKPQRYFKEIFKDVSFETVTYGKNKTQSGKNVELQMDIYQPKGDKEKMRPVFIYAHGGGFTGGDKRNIKGFGLLQSIAKSGFVVVSIQYRLIDVARNEITSAIGTLNAIEDMRAAIRFFKKDAATENEYKIDPDQIIIGGYSAGAITALHTGYINSLEELQTYTPQLVPHITANGGLEGNSGNPGYDSKVKGIVNIAGAIVDEHLIETGEPALYSLHGESDTVVPIGNGALLKGSRIIHEQATKVGVDSKLNAVPNQGHNVLFECVPCITKLKRFLATHVN